MIQKLDFLAYNAGTIKVLWNKQHIGTIQELPNGSFDTTPHFGASRVTSNFKSLSDAVSFFYGFNLKTYIGNTHKRPAVRFSNEPKLHKQRWALDGYPYQDFTDPNKYSHVAANTHYIKRDGEN